MSLKLKALASKFGSLYVDYFMSPSQRAEIAYSLLKDSCVEINFQINQDRICAGSSDIERYIKSDVARALADAILKHGHLVSEVSSRNELNITTRRFRIVVVK